MVFIIITLLSSLLVFYTYAQKLGYIPYEQKNIYIVATSGEALSFISSTISAFAAIN